MNRFGLLVAWMMAVGPVGLAHAQTGAETAIPFTTYSAEQKAASEVLPCKWVSLNGTFAGGRYDFLCKGGVWATVSLFLRQPTGMADSLAEVKVQYRDWRENVHPNAGEAFVAQEFLTFAVDRFVPASVAGAVNQAFWQERDRTWEGSGVRVEISYKDGKDFGLRELRVTGGDPTPIKPNPGVVREGLEGIKESIQKVFTPTPAKETPKDGGLLKPRYAEEVIQPEPKWREPVREGRPLTLPAPQSVPTDDSGMPNPLKLLVPDDAPAGPLEKATMDELKTSPEPKSQQVPAPPPPVAGSLVPDPNMLIEGREKAPSNFDAYNRAEQLTKDIEKRAMGVEEKAAPVKAADEAQKTLLKAPPERPAPPVKPVPTPGAEAAGSLRPVDQPGRSEPVRLQREDGGWTGGLDAGSKQQGLPQFTPSRPLPQLQFVPRAEPVRGDEVIRFEDEGSRL